MHCGKLNCLSKIKDEECVTGLDDYKWVETDLIALYVNNNSVTYFDSFGVEHIPKEIKKFTGNKKSTTYMTEYKPLIQWFCNYQNLSEIRLYHVV